ncbi:MAG: SpoIIE family protein phosphatase [candidate division Zixibacteria bacterium]|nr:serine/threonine-protein phosphatase [candidate division Zixibacteria bacterium]NIV07567.1 SpoIIE family protein phosphatase [candidate division Zixibacteria bacterium]NIX57783.1 SpoIIE family protein phosphatase [candidate division Zixibacteria bacterium]
MQKATPEVSSELKNFENIARNIKPDPGEIPHLPGIEIYGETMPLSGEVGGDHLIYIDFDKRFDIDARIQEALLQHKSKVAEKLKEAREKAGILLADASGHSITDALLTAMLHQAFLVGADYEMTINGEITVDLFEAINSRFYYSSSIDKFITMIYGEIHRSGEFKFISAGHPLPLVFSVEYDRLVNINQEHMTIFPPIGTMPSEVQVDAKKQQTSYGYKPRYVVNTINIMGAGDIMLLFTDGFQEQKQGEINFVSLHLENLLREVKYQSAREICTYLIQNFFKLVQKADDDVTLVVVKKNW